MKKEFSITKWIVLPLINLTMCGIVLYFNLEVFGEKGKIYIPIVGLLFGTSLFFCYYVDSDNPKVSGLAYILEVLLICVLIGSGVYCLSVQREMTIASEASAAQKKSLEDITKLRGSRTQREALKLLSKGETSLEVFKEKEQILFWLLMCELIASSLGAVALIGVSKFTSLKAESTSIALELPQSSRASFKASPVQGLLASRKSESEYLYNDIGTDYFRVKHQNSGAQIWNESKYLKHISRRKLEDLGELTYEKIKALL